MEQTVKKGNRTANPAFALKTHRDLPRMTEAKFVKTPRSFSRTPIMAFRRLCAGVTARLCEV
jgi:hypothetical protein